MRSLGIDRVAQESYDSGDYDAEWFDIAHAYADGVNDYVKGVSLTAAEESSQTGRLLPLEFLIFGVEWDPWTPVDSIGFQRFMLFSLMHSWQGDL